MFQQDPRYHLDRLWNALRLPHAVALQEWEIDLPDVRLLEGEEADLQQCDQDGTDEEDAGLGEEVR